MKTALTSLLILLMLFTAHAQQNIGCEIRGMYSRSITLEKLEASKKLSDLITGYPNNWITDYISVELSVTGNGKDEKEIGIDEMLTSKQKTILSEAILGNDIEIEVKYNYENAVTHEKTKHTMFVKMTVVPEYEAQFPGLYETSVALSKSKNVATLTPEKKYLKENIVDKLSAEMLKSFADKTAKVIFAINEFGAVTDVKVYLSSLDNKTDQLIIDALNKMPRWKPAQTTKGKKVKQYLELVVGNTGC